MSISAGIAHLPFDSPTGFEAEVSLSMPMLFETPATIHWRGDEDYKLFVTDEQMCGALRDMMGGQDEEQAAMDIPAFKQKAGIFWSKFSIIASPEGLKYELVDEAGAHTGADPEAVLKEAVKALPPGQQANMELTGTALSLLIQWKHKLPLAVTFIAKLQREKPAGQQEPNEGPDQLFKYATDLPPSAMEGGSPFNRLTAVYKGGDLTMVPPGQLAAVALEGPPGLGMLAVMPMKFRSARPL